MARTERQATRDAPAERPQLSRVELTLVPPVDLDFDSPDKRYARLAQITSDHTVPRLLALHRQAPPANQLAETEIHKLAELVLGPNGDGAAGVLLRLREQGVSLDQLHAELLGPTASYLGELWDNDKIDFVDVTLGVARLQRLVMTFEGLGNAVADAEDRRKILIVGAPGEQHSLGNSIIQRCFRASGWQVWSCITPALEEVARISSEDWFGVVGFSMSLDTHFVELQKAIGRIRDESLNRKVSIIVGGSAIHRHPDWVSELGADGTAANGPTAVVLANKLLAASLI